MRAIPKHVKRAALMALVTLGVIGGSVSAASAHYYTRSCDRDGDDCVTLRCDNDGDDCRPVSNRAYRTYDQDSYDNGYSYGYSSGWNGGDGWSPYYGVTVGPRYGGEHEWRQHGHYHDDDDD
jgi:hypothetical protein